MSPTVHEEMRSDVHASAAIHKLETRSEGATSKAHRLDKLTDPGPIAEAEAEMEFVTQEADEIEEETLFVDEMPGARGETCTVPESVERDNHASE